MTFAPRAACTARRRRMAMPANAAPAAARTVIAGSGTATVFQERP
jgi:hypothetical protein